MTRRLMVRAIGPIAALLIVSGSTTAAEPFHGFFRPRGGEYYSPLHYWAPGGYKIKYYCGGPECHGARVSVHPPPRPVEATVIVSPAAPPGVPPK